MNKTVTFLAALNPAVSGTPVRARIPLIVPNGFAFRLRYVLWVLQDARPSDAESFCALSRIADEPLRASLATLLTGNQYLSMFTWGVELVTTGMSTSPLHQKDELWDLDYRLVMAPTYHMVGITNWTNTFCRVAGELVPVTEGERNAIIAWQGGAKDA